MENDPSLAGLVQEIERLCVENEVARFLLKETWPPQRAPSAFAALNQGYTDALVEFRSRSKISEPTLVSKPDVQEQCANVLRLLTRAIRKTRSTTIELVEKEQKTLPTDQTL